TNHSGTTCGRPSVDTLPTWTACRSRNSRRTAERSRSSSITTCGSPHPQGDPFGQALQRGARVVGKGRPAEGAHGGRGQVVDQRGHGGPRTRTVHCRTGPGGVL